MPNRSTATSINEYIAEFSPETQKALEEMRALIKATAPDATETISYAIPTFDLNGKHLVHFAGYAKHVGFYPVPSAMRVPSKGGTRRTGGPGAAGISVALTALVLLTGVVGCTSSQTAAPQPTQTTTAATPSSNAPSLVTPEGLTDAEKALVIGAYEDGSGETTPVSIAPLSFLGVSADELIVGDDTYTVADCLAVAPSADALANGDAVDRGGVHIVYLAPDRLSAGYLGSYADLIR